MKFDEHAINGIYAKKMTTVSNKLPVCNEKWYNKKTLHKKKKKYVAMTTLMDGKGNK